MHNTKMTLQKYPKYRFHDVHHHHSLGILFDKIQAFYLKDYLNHLEPHLLEEQLAVDLLEQ
ncbi:hypothetical protein D3C75_1093670 [compost metagenome]